MRIHGCSGHLGRLGFHKGGVPELLAIAPSEAMRKSVRALKTHA